MEAALDQFDPLFTSRCGDRAVFCIGLLARFCENEHIDSAKWLLIAGRAQQTFGGWPVHFVDRDEQQRNSQTRFTGYRMIADCSAFAPQDPKTIEKAILIWHQPAASCAVSDTAMEGIANLDWLQIAEATQY